MFRMQALYSSPPNDASHMSSSLPMYILMPGVTLGMDRLAMLHEILAANPDDAFARYGLAMEYAKTDVNRAMQEFQTLLSKHPDYTAGYFMAAQTLASSGRTEEAKSMLTKGIETAKRSGNSHAESEMQGMLADLS
jgi:predicted Zn-dependent protease